MLLYVCNAVTEERCDEDEEAGRDSSYRTIHVKNVDFPLRQGDTLRTLHRDSPALVGM